MHHAQEHDLPAAQALRHRHRASNHPHARQRAHDCMLSTTKYAECPLSTSERTQCRRRLAMRCRRRVAFSIFGFHPSSLSVECAPSHCGHGYSTSAILRSSCTAQPFRIDPAHLLQAANLVGCAVTFSQSIRSVSAPPQSPSRAHHTAAAHTVRLPLGYGRCGGAVATSSLRLRARAGCPQSTSCAAKELLCRYNCFVKL